MRFNLGPLGQPGDPFGDDKEITVDLGEGPRARPEKLFKSGERDRFAGLGDGPEEVLRVPPTSQAELEKLFKSGERDRFAGLGDGPEEVLWVPPTSQAELDELFNSREHDRFAGLGDGPPLKLPPTKSYAENHPPAASRDRFAGLGDGPEEVLRVPPTSQAELEKLFKSGERDRFAGLGDGPEEVLRVPGDDAGEGSFRKGSDSGAQDGDFEDRGQIIESESLYRSSTGWEVRKRIVMSKSGRERTVVSCPGHLVVI